MIKPGPLTLEGTEVRLPPLSLDHLDGLCAVGLDPELWQWVPTRVLDREQMRAYVELALDEQRRGVSVPFTTTLKENGQVVGSTRYANISVPDGRLEIGWTWIGKAWQRSAVNTEAKYLMLRHAFETWSCNRVELLTDERNTRSRRAIERLGAREEGTVRCHMVMRDGFVSNSVLYSLVSAEWPAAEAALRARLGEA